MVLGIVGLASLSACTAFVKEVSEFQSGWRTAEVKSLGKAAELAGSGLTDCRATASEMQLASSRFALLSYRMAGGRPHSHIVIVDDSAVVAVGDTVYTNVMRCDAVLAVR